MIFLLLLVSGAVFAALFRTWRVEDLLSSVSGIPTGEESAVCFYARADLLPSGDVIKLFEDGKQVGELRDDGTSPDETEGDGIFSGMAILRCETEKIVTFHASYRLRRSKPLSFVYYDPLTDEQIDRYEEHLAAFDAIESPYCGEDGLIAQEDVPLLLDELEQYARDHLSLDDIQEVKRGETDLMVTFSGGIPFVYEPYTEAGVLSAEAPVQGPTMIPTTPEEESETRFYENGFGLAPSEDAPSGRIVVAEPFSSTIQQWIVSGLDYIIAGNKLYEDSSDWHAEAVARNVAKAASFYTLEEADIMIDREVQATRLRYLGSFGLLIWDGHGGYKDEHGPTLALYADTTKGELLTHMADFRLNLMTSCKASGVKCFQAFPEFFARYLSYSPGAIVFLSSCHGLQDDRLSNVFFAKGASVVIGFDHVVSSFYALQFEKTFFELLTAPLDGRAPTVREAFDRTVQICGPSDSINGTHPVLRAMNGGENKTLLMLEQQTEATTRSPRHVPSPHGLSEWIDGLKQKVADDAKNQQEALRQTVSEWIANGISRLFDAVGNLFLNALLALLRMIEKLLTG